VSKNSGEAFVKRITDFIAWAQSKGYQFARTDDFAKEVINSSK
jgi:hypothetical protein